MEFVWLGVGFAVGALVVWIYFSIQSKRRAAEYEVRVQQECSKIRQTTDEERETYQFTKRRLTVLENEFAKAAEQTTAISSELSTCSARLDSERTSHLQTRQRLSQSEADRSNAIARADAIQSELQEAIQRFENQKTSETGASDRLAQLQTETESLEERLNEEQISRDQIETQLREAQATIISASIENKNRIGELEESLRAAGEKIRELETELAGRDSKPENTTQSTPDEPDQDVSAQEQPPEVAAVPADDGDIDDDLTKIKGIGRVLKQKLNTLGVTSFRQIADFDEAEIARINENLDFPGRIEREDWIKQARKLASQAVQ